MLLDCAKFIMSVPHTTQDENGRLGVAQLARGRSSTSAASLLQSLTGVWGRNRPVLPPSGEHVEKTLKDTHPLAVSSSKANRRMERWMLPMNGAAG